MASLEQDIIQVLSQCRAEIQANMANKGINASGRTSRAFAITRSRTGMALILKHDARVPIEMSPRHIGSFVFGGTAPLQTLQTGREGGKVPVGFYYIIKQWTRDKGLSFGSESERQRFSYFTARKIAREGTERHTRPVQVWAIPVNRAKERINADIRALVSQAVLSSAQSQYKF